MGPRKRPRPNPADGRSDVPPTTDTPITTLPDGWNTASTASAEPSVPNSPFPSSESATRSSNTSTGDSQAAGRQGKQVHRSRSWYGSWPRLSKSPASTQVARESFSVGTLKPDKSPNFARFDTKRSVAADSSGSGAGAAADPSATALPRIEEGEGISIQQPVPPEDSPPGSRGQAHATKSTGGINPGTDASAPIGSKNGDAPSPELLQPSTENAVNESHLAKRPATASGWLGWFGRPATPSLTDRSATAQPVVPQAAACAPETVDVLPEGDRDGEPAEVPADQQLDSPTSTWFGLWPRRPVAARRDELSDAGRASQSARDVGGREDAVMQDSNVREIAAATPVTAAPESLDIGSPQAQPAGSTWAFWSRDSRTKTRESGAARQEPGEIAVIGQGSEAHPRPASSVEVGVDVRSASSSSATAQPPPPAHRSTPSPPPTLPVNDPTTRKPKRLRPRSMEIPDSPVRPGTPKSTVSSRPDSAGNATKAPSSTAQTESPSKSAPANLLLPPLRSTYRMKENPSIFQQLAQLLLRTQQPPSGDHVFLTRDVPRIKKALAIGVHGLFPAAYLRPMIGQPTGTSIKFANLCAEGIRRWADSHGSETCEIEKVALEGEGKIADRVENLWKLLLNWIDHIREADLIVIACHSQGVPVAIMLVAKLIELGIITAPRIGVCAMAGVCLGPFPDYRSSMGMLMGSAAELWEFADPTSEVSRRFEASLGMVLEYGARVTFIGSIDDQVVPIESAVYSPASHPHIYRATFIDGRLHAPDFIANLVGFALRLRNMGVSDHGLVRELSVPLAGSLYSGEGHSRLYDDPQVYDLAVSHALETSSVGKIPCTIRKHESVANPNPYHLPWVMRGLLEEAIVKTELTAETTRLLTQFDNWKPANKALKDVKYRLEVVRSKL